MIFVDLPTDINDELVAFKPSSESIRSHLVGYCDDASPAALVCGNDIFANKS